MTYEEFNLLWEKELKTELSKLEEMRSQEKGAIFLGVFIAISIFLIFISLWQSVDIGVPVFLSIACGTGSYYLRRPKHYKRLYKESVIAALMKQTRYKWRLDTLSYTGEKMTFQAAKRYFEMATSRNNVREEIFKSSGLYRTSITSFTTDDTFVSETMPLEAAEITAVRGSGKNRQTIFRGLMFKFDITKTLSGETYIRNEKGSAFSIPMGSGGKFSFSSTAPKTTMLEWNDFEKILDVQTTNEVEAREILDPQFMNVLYEWWITHKRAVRIGFKDHHFYLAAPFERNLFEPHPFSSIEKHKDELWGYVDAFLFAERLFIHIEHKYRMDLRQGDINKTI